MQTEIDCSGYYEPSSPAGPGAPPEMATAAQQAAAARRLVDQIYGLLGSPQVAADQGLSGLLDELLATGAPA